MQKHFIFCFNIDRRNNRMKYMLALILCALACVPLPVRAQEKNEKSAGTPALEKELFAVELKWIDRKSVV
jgi:hypothetical protein